MKNPTPKQGRVWRVLDMIKWGESFFSSKGFEHPKREIEWFLCDLLDYKRIDLYVQFEEPLTKSQLETLRSWVQRRVNREPLQYITGKSEFYGRPFKLNPAVLIPRPETERVVDVSLHAVGNLEKPTILDIGTGSGCIAISLAAERPDAQVTALDISEEALDVARENSVLNGLQNIQFMKMNILSSRPAGTFDLVVSNPPYILEEELETLMPEVYEYEPLVALTDKNDGLTFYRRFAEIASEIINPGGWLVTEVGLGNHPSRVQALFSAAGFLDWELIQDFNGDDRVLKIHL